MFEKYIPAAVERNVGTRAGRAEENIERGQVRVEDRSRWGVLRRAERITIVCAESAEGKLRADFELAVVRECRFLARISYIPPITKETHTFHTERQ